MTDEQNILPGFSPVLPYVRQKRPHKPIFSTRPKRIWLVSFTDFMSLMVAFFVMMYSMGNPELTKFQEVSDSFSQELNIDKPGLPKSFAGPKGQMSDSDVISLGRVRNKSGKDIIYLSDVLNNKRKDIPELAGLVTQLEGDVLLVSLPTERLVDMNRDVTTRASRVVAHELAGLLAGMNNRIELVVDWDGNPDAGIIRALKRGEAIHRTLQENGMEGNMLVMIRASPTPAVAGPPRTVLRITRFQ